MKTHSSWSIEVLVAAIATSWLSAQTNWTPVPPPSVVTPRQLHAMAFDVVHGRTVVFGGTTGLLSTTVIARTETWDGLQWSTPVLVVQPPPRRGHAMAADLVRGRVVLFGGQLVGATEAGTWEWDGASWSFSSAAAPPARFDAAMAYDVASQRTLLFGGAHDLGPRVVALDDTWEWNGVAWTQRTPTTVPPARFSHAMAHDLLRGRTVLFGGGGGGNLDDTWEWNGTMWISINSAVRPSARSGHCMAFDLASGRTLAFGGVDTTTGADLDDLWAWDGLTWRRQLPVAGPSPRAGAALAHDFIRGRTVLFGGYGSSSLKSDTWEWDGTAWLTRSATTPPLRDESNAVFDAARGRGLLFGGYSTSGPVAFLSDTWSWSAGSWTQQIPANHPQARRGHGLAYDAARQRAVLFGGYDGNSAVSDLADTWLWDGANWTLAATTSGPAARSGAAMAYDEARQEVVLFGGYTPFPLVMYQDTWTWDGVAWTQRTPALRPSPRTYAALAYDRARQRTVLFGGSSGIPRGDTWEWDGSTWISRTPAHQPVAVGGASLVFDPTRGRCVLFGGLGSSTELDATWEWDGADWIARAPSTRPAPRARAAAFFDPGLERTVLFGGYVTGTGGASDSWFYRPVTPATVQSFGSGCAGSVGVPLLRTDARPWLGTSFPVVVESVPVNAPLFLAIGFSRVVAGGQPLPASLAPIGMAGCTMFVSIDLPYAFAAVGQRGELALAIPSTASLAGVSFYGQAAVVDPPANPAGLVDTNALACVIGGL